MTEQDCFEKNDVKNGQKVPKTWFFGLFKKIKALVLSGIGVKAKFSWSFNTAKTAYLGKIWFSSYGQNWPVVFNPQYFINRLISDFDFWNVDRHE